MLSGGLDGGDMDVVGSVVIEVDKNMTTLLDFTYQKVYSRALDALVLVLNVM